MGPLFPWQGPPGTPSSSYPGLLRSPWEEAGNKPQHEEVWGPDCPLPRAALPTISVPPVSFLGGVLPPWRRGGTFPSSSCAVRPHGHQSSPRHPQPGPPCLSPPHLSQSPLAPACPSVMGTLTAGGSERPPCCRRHPQARSQGRYEVCYKERSQAEETPAPTERAPSKSWLHPACTHLIRNAHSVQDWGRLLMSTVIPFNIF